MRRIPITNGLLAFALTVLIFASTYASAPLAVEPELRLYFVPFSIRGFYRVVVTCDDLKKQGPLLFKKDHPFISELFVTLTATPFSRYERVPSENPTQPPGADLSKERADYEDCRLIADFGEKRGEFIASGGGVVKRLKDNATFSLSEEQRKHLQNRILSFRGVIDTSALRSFSE
jgi:hypothetical protein